MNDEVEVAAARLGVEADVGHAHNFTIDHGRDDIVGVAIVDTVDHHLAAENHLPIVLLRVLVDPRAEGLDLDHYLQRLAEAILVGEVDDL